MLQFGRILSVAFLISLPLSNQAFGAEIPLVINELMAANSSSIRDPQGQYDDWIEIHNYGVDAIDIGGMYLTDDLPRPAKWRITGDGRDGTIVPAGGYLLV